MSRKSSTTTAQEPYFEDYVVGAVQTLGVIAVDQDEMIAFARRFDPQPFHTDPQAAQQTIYGGLIASGWHTAALMMRLYADHYLSPVSSLGSPGVDKLRWLRPVRPGDQLVVHVTILEARRSQSKPDRGIVRSSIEVINQNGEVVLTMEGINFILCRERTA